MLFWFGLSFTMQEVSLYGHPCTRWAIPRAQQWPGALCHPSRAAFLPAFPGGLAKPSSSEINIHSDYSEQFLCLQWSTGCSLSLTPHPPFMLAPSLPSLSFTSLIFLPHWCFLITSSLIPLFHHLPWSGPFCPHSPQFSSRRCSEQGAPTDRALHAPRSGTAPVSDNPRY